MQNFDKNRQMLRRQLLHQRQSQALKTGNLSGESSVALQEIAGIPVGKLKIEAIYENGEQKVLVDENNLVVRQAEEIMAFMSIGLRSINYIELGDPSPAKAPELSDLVLQQTTGLRKTTTNTTSGKTAIHTALWGTTEGNGYNFTEAGLFTNPLGTGIMFARKVFEQITKLASFSLKFTWAVVYSVREHNEGCSGVSLLGGSTITADYVYESTLGGEVEFVVPIDFLPGAKQLDVYLRGQRWVYNRQYYETTLGSVNGIRFIGFTLNAGDIVYVVNRKLV